MTPMSSPVWLLFDAEKRGSENQCRGLAAGLKREALPFAIPEAGLMRFIPRCFWGKFFRPGRGLLRNITGPLPDLIISSGTRASVVAAYLRKEAHKKQISEEIPGACTRVINLLNPRLPCHWFDLIIAPEHDKLVAPNIIQTLGPINGLGRELSTLPKQHSTRKRIITVLIGGKSQSFGLSPKELEILGYQMNHLARTQDVRFLVSFSRRTPTECKKALWNQIKKLDLQLYDGVGDNPYKQFLIDADVFIVTGDSMSMITEACVTGKPVYVTKVKNMPAKFKTFHASLEQHGYIKPFKGILEKWTGKQLNEMPEVTQKVKDFLKRL